LIIQSEYNTIRKTKQSTYQHVILKEAEKIMQNYFEVLVTQSYVGTSVVSGETSGVQVIVK
jgi:hypothetical protein